MKHATGADDPALAGTTWPLPDETAMETHHRLVWTKNRVDHEDLSRAASIISAYHALICDGTTAEQTKRLAALRRVWRRRQ